MRYNPIRETSPVFLLLCAVFYSAGMLLFRGQYVPGSAVVFIVSGWVISLCIHEYGHALMAFLGGDRSVLRNGYLSLNFFSYAHPLLSFAVPLVSMAMGGFGLPGAAVEIQANRIRGRSWQSLICAAGPLCDLLLFTLIVLVLRQEFFSGSTPAFRQALAFVGFLQLTSVVFNMLPIPGLDGFGILEPWLGGIGVRLPQMVRNITYLLPTLLFVMPTDRLKEIYVALYRLADQLGLNSNLIQPGYQLLRTFF